MKSENSANLFEKQQLFLWTMKSMLYHGLIDQQRQITR